MKIFFSALIVTGILAGDVAYAQTPPASPAKPTSPTPAPPQTSIKIPEPPSPMLEPFNIRVDVAVQEEGAEAPVLRKEVSLTVSNGRNGSVRSGGVAAEDKEKPFSRLWVDVTPLLVGNGKPLVVSQASSATSSRRMRVELTATVLK